MNLVEFIFFFLAIWFGVTGFLALLGGWPKLSKIFRDTYPPQAPQFIAQSICVGGVSYGRCINACLTTGGLHLRIFFLFRFLHPPLFIPWSEITSITAKKWFFFTSYQVVIRQIGTKIYFYGKLGESILKEWQEQSPTLTPFR